MRRLDASSVTSLVKERVTRAFASVARALVYPAADFAGDKADGVFVTLIIRSEHAEYRNAFRDCEFSLVLEDGREIALPQPVVVDSGVTHVRLWTPHFARPSGVELRFGFRASQPTVRRIAIRHPSQATPRFVEAA